MEDSILARILAHKKREVADLKSRVSLSEIKARAADFSPAADFASVLLSDEKPRIIAEIKKASPSKGVIAADFDPVLTAGLYQRGGAAAISVLTDEEFFGGSLDCLSAVKNEVSVPVLRKDFLIDPRQIYESRAAGADTVLLIVAAIRDEGRLSELLELSRSLGMEPLVEVHSETELEAALGVRSRIIGINNRNLSSFEVDLSVSGRLAPIVGKDKITVSESGITSSQDMLFLAECGVDAFLIGEKFMASPNPERALSGMIEGWTR